MKMPEGEEEHPGRENRLVDTAWEGEGGKNCESSMETYTLLLLLLLLSRFKSLSRC